MIRYIWRAKVSFRSLFDGADCAVFAFEKKQRISFADNYILDLGDEDGMVASVLDSVESALEVGEGTAQHRGTVCRTIKFCPGFFFSSGVDPFGVGVVLRDHLLVFAKNIYAKALAFIEMSMSAGPPVDANQYQ